MARIIMALIVSIALMLPSPVLAKSKNHQASRNKNLARLCAVWSARSAAHEATSHSHKDKGKNPHHNWQRKVEKFCTTGSSAGGSSGSSSGGSSTPSSGGSSSGSSGSGTGQPISDPFVESGGNILIY